MSDSENYRILLVDDEPDILEFLGYNLKKEGFVVPKTGERPLPKHWTCFRI